MPACCFCGGGFCDISTDSAGGQHAGQYGNILQLSQIFVFSPQQLRKATKHFHDDHKLGKGRFGSVYKGTLLDGQEIAVKKLSNSNEMYGNSDFKAEINTISRGRHRNLIRLFGYCVDRNDKYLIYEYLENLSLDKHLFAIGGRRMSMLSWNTRKKIIQGTAKGLSYLHYDLNDRIVHRDIKAANILLDKAMEAKIADFGLARLYSFEESHHSTIAAGTIGYIAPEVFNKGQVTQKSDTYSFGVVILEILSGRRGIDASLPSDRRNLLDWAYMLYKSQRYTDLMDPLIKDEYTEEEASQIIWLGLMCTQATPKERPTMKEVVSFLEREINRDAMGTPSRPGHAVLNASLVENSDHGSNGFPTGIYKDNLDIYSFQIVGR